MRLLTMIVSLVCITALGGCREDERDRIMVFEQGAYQGRPDGPLEREQVDALRDRARRQQY